jgi:tetratricopeptide (TPR) repeat protein
MIEILKLQYDDNFVGREEEITELKEKIENNGIVVITGGRGIGKTNLMLVVKKEVEKEKECHHISKGSIFYDRMSEIFKSSLLSKIKGISLPFVGINWDLGKNPLLEGMVKSKERIIFVEDAQLLDRKALDLIFDASLRNERLRFILEIATPYKPVEKLGRGPYEPFEVKELSNKSTAQLVKGVCPDLSDLVVRRIVSLSRGYPYVARALAYLICNNKNTEEEMLKFFEIFRDKDRGYNLDKIHKEILNTLNEDSQGVIKRLAIAPQILTLKLIEAFCKGIPDNLDPALSDLFDRGILVKEGDGKGFYRIYHPLFREYLKSEKIQPIASERWKRYYHEAMKNVKTEFDSIYILLEVLNESDIFKELIELTENYEAINSVGVQSYTWGKLVQAIYAWNHLLEKSKDANNIVVGSIAIGNIGNVYRIKGELDKALEYYEKALKINEELGIKEGMAIDLGNIGSVYGIKGELEEALDYYEKALELNEDLGRKEGMVVALGNIGIVYQTRGELEKALEYYEKALELNEDLGRKEGIASQLRNIGIVHETKGELEKALEYYEKALKLDKDLGKREGMAANLGNIGNIYQTRGELEKALEYYEKALKLNEGLGKKEGIAVALGNIGIVYETKGEPEKALEYYERALKLNEDLGRKEGMAKQLRNIGIVYETKEELEKGLEYYRKALRIFNEMGNKIETARTLMNIGDAFAQKGDKKRALDYYREAKSLAKGSSVFEEISKRINKLLGAD